MKTSDQPMLFAPPRGNAPRSAEADSIYDAVLKLRRAGYKVIHKGRWMHSVDGVSLDRARLVEMAAGL